MAQRGDSHLDQVEPDGAVLGLQGIAETVPEGLSQEDIDTVPWGVPGLDEAAREDEGPEGRGQGDRGRTM